MKHYIQGNTKQYNAIVTVFFHYLWQKDKEKNYRCRWIIACQKNKVNKILVKLCFHLNLFYIKNEKWTSYKWFILSLVQNMLQFLKLVLSCSIYTSRLCYCIISNMKRVRTHLYFGNSSKNKIGVHNLCKSHCGKG